MSEHETHPHEGHAGQEGHGGGGHHPNYTKIYFTLLILFAVSVMGPYLGEITGWVWLTLLTAFGIAVWKAKLVIENFMHLKWEKRIMKWMLATSLIFMFILVAGVAPDVMNHEGTNWENVAAKESAVLFQEEGQGEEPEHAEESAAGEATAVAEGGFDARAAYNQACATCHGTAGDGKGPAGAALNPPPANFTDPAFWATRERERIFKVIKEGAASVGGSPLMVAWGASFTDEEIEALTDYVMSFRPEGQE